MGTTVLFMALSALAGSITIAWAVGQHALRHANERGAARAAFDVAAAALGTEARGSWPNVFIDATIDGTPVRARTNAYDASTLSPLVTRVSAPVGDAPAFALHRQRCRGTHAPGRGYTVPLAHVPSGWLGWTDDPGATVPWIDGVADLVEPYCFGSDGDVWAWRAGGEADGKRLVAAMRGVAELAKGAARTVARWDRLARALGARAVPGATWNLLWLEGFHAGVAFVAETLPGATTQTRVSIELARDATPDADDIEVDGRRAGVLLPGIVLDAAPIRSAVERLAPLAAIPEGPYR
ncbi:MAG TPA: hypothetical protein VKE22_14210 [Haliangiales bacterium]|nr:hypothetical protein [Haliangiales bacterium]